MTGLDWANGHDPLPALLERFIEQGQAGLDAGIAALAEVVQTDMVAVLSETEHPAHTPTTATRGGPPAKVSGLLAELVAKAVKFRPGGAIAFIGPTGERKHIARFMQHGWHPHHGKRRSRAERRRLPATGKVAYPFLAPVRDRTIAQAGPVVAEAVRFHLGRWARRE